MTIWAPLRAFVLGLRAPPDLLKRGVEGSNCLVGLRNVALTRGGGAVLLRGTWGRKRERKCKPLSRLGPTAPTRERSGDHERRIGSWRTMPPED